MPERDGLQYLGKRQDGRHVWRVRPYVGKPPRRVTATFDMPNANKGPARKRAGEVVEGLKADAEQVDAKRPTVAQVLDDWIERGTRKSPRTLQGYRRRADRIAAKFGNVRADQLTPDMVDGWYHELRAAGKTSESELLEIHKVFSAALQWARKLRRITEAATEFVERPKHQPPKIKPPDTETMRRLLTGLPDAEWARAVALLVLTGMRRGEVVGLRWEDIEPGQMWVRHSVLELPGEERVSVQPFPKGREHRCIELHPAAAAVLEQQRAYILGTKGRTSLPVWVFPDWASWRLRDPRRPGSVSRAWDRYRNAKKAKGVRLHDLRHFHATQALANGARVHDVAEQLGHKDVVTTIRIYGHGTDDGRRVVVDAVAGALGLGVVPELAESPAP